MPRAYVKKPKPPHAQSAVERGIPKVIVDALTTDQGIDDSRIRPEATLRDDLGLDSLDLVELSIDLEADGKGVIDFDVVDDWVTLADVIKTLEARR